MNWSESISRTIEYIENNLTNNITTQDIANYLYILSFYFQIVFSNKKSLLVLNVMSKLIGC